MAFTLTSVSPATVPEDGGHLFVITGTFVMGHQYKIYIGKTGTTADAACYSGKGGQGNVVYPHSATAIQAYSPILPLGGPHTILVVDAGTAEEHTLAKSFTATYRDLKSTPYGLRKVLPHFYKMGPRNIDVEEQGVGDYVPPWGDPEAAWWTFAGTPDGMKLLGTDPDAAKFDPQSNSNDFTVAGVIATDDIVNALAIFCKWVSTNFNRSWMIQHWGDDLEFYITSNGGVGTISSLSVPNILVLGTKTFFCARYHYVGAGTSEMFLRCQDTVNSRFDAQGPVHSSTGAHVQVAHSDAGNFFEGDQHWLAYWNRKLTDSEVAALRAKTTLPQELTPDYYEDYHDAVVATNVSEMPILAPITFTVEGAPTHGGSSNTTAVEEVTRTLAKVGLLEGFTQMIGETDAEIGGFRMTRTTAVISATDTTFKVETTTGWPTSGKVSLDGIVYYYTGVTATTFTGITHIAGGSSVAGARIKHRTNNTVVDLSRNWSGLDQLRRAMLVDYAEEDDLDALGRNMAVNRLPFFEDDDQFRAVIKALSYNPKGTILGLTLALEAIAGVGNFEIYEDLIKHHNKVFFKIGPSLEAVSAGKTYLTGPEWAALSGAQKTLTLSQTPLAVSSARLHDLGELFDFKNAKPSAITYPYYPGGTPSSAFTYAGGEAETQVVVTAGKYTTLTSGAGGTVYYEMLHGQGARIRPESYVEVSALLMIPGGTPIGADMEQCSITIHDGDFRASLGVNHLGVGLFNTVGGGFLTTPYGTSLDVWYEVTLKKFGTDRVEIWIDGNFKGSVLYSAFASATALHKSEWGIRGTPNVGMTFRIKQLGYKIETVTDFWNARGTAGSVLAATNWLINDNIALLVAGDVGKYLTIRGGTAKNLQGGTNNGHHLITSYVAPGQVGLGGSAHSEAATVQTANPKRIIVDDLEEFTFPDDLGKRIIISGSLLGNDGTYYIAKLFAHIAEQSPPNDYKDLATYKTDDQITAKTNVCEVTAAAFVSESGLDYKIWPTFVNEAGLDWELSDASSFSGATITLRQALWANTLIMEVAFSDVLTGQVLADNQEVNAVIATGPPILYESYPFYVGDPLGVYRAYLDDLTAAGVIPDFLIE